MAEKNLSLAILFDIYSPLISEKKREIFDMYYNDDLSLAEISEHTGTSRQAVRDLLARTGKELEDFECELSLKKKGDCIKEKLDILRRICPEEAQNLINEIYELI